MSTISRRVLHLEGRQQCWWEEDWAGACCSGVQPRQFTARSQACQRAKPSACRLPSYTASQALSLPFFSEAACTPPRVSLAGPGAAFELQRHSSYYGKTTTAARGGGARGTVAMPPGGGWVLPCLRRASPRAKKIRVMSYVPRAVSLPSFRLSAHSPPPSLLHGVIRAPKHNWQKWRRRSSSMRCHRLIARSWCAACKRHSLLALLRRCTALLSLPLPSVLHSRVLHAACSTQHAMQLSLPPYSPTNGTRWETSSTRMWSVSSASHWRPR